ncbi:MAG: YiiX/YebB-like N1pC/P60 family cysteine hydrolase [Nitrospiraceae bacterium]|nr:YiiX/YebB-like N1pC/P60 family cysteine hydrolase [Nitrospiraceae bacterium]
MQSSSAAKQAFAWNQDAYWKTLEGKYAKLRQTGCRGAEADVKQRLDGLKKLLTTIDSRMFGPEASEFDELERQMFEAAPLVSACNAVIAEYLDVAADMRTVIKRQSEHWNIKSDAARITLYRLLYGSRGAIEEIMTQVTAGSVPALLKGTDEPSATPSAVVRNARLHSGDILVSRGGAPTSALIARGNDYPGNFSHIAFVYVDPETKEAKIVESHIEVGVVVSTVEQYLSDKKMRVMLLRPRADLPQIRKDPIIPHKAAKYAYDRAKSTHVPYDFTMDYKDHSKLFCSEVASEPYERFGINLWAGVSHISSPGLRRWLAAFGVKHFETQEPSDLEYDPQLRVVAEWRDPQTLKKDRIDNAVTEVMVEGAEKGDEIGYAWYLLPFARLVKAYSMLLNQFGKAGPIPEGMSATTALRTKEYMAKHEGLGKRLTPKIEEYKKKYGYVPPYWELVRLAREVK